MNLFENLTLIEPPSPSRTNAAGVCRTLDIGTAVGCRQASDLHEYR
jgi:hypothetical protein